MTTDELRGPYTEAVKIVRQERRALRAPGEYVLRGKPEMQEAKLREIGSPLGAAARHLAPN